MGDVVTKTGADEDKKKPPAYVLFELVLQAYCEMRAINKNYGLKDDGCTSGVLIPYVLDNKGSDWYWTPDPKKLTNCSTSTANAFMVGLARGYNTETVTHGGKAYCAPIIGDAEAPFEMYQFWQLARPTSVPGWYHGSARALQKFNV